MASIKKGVFNRIDPERTFEMIHGCRLLLSRDIAVFSICITPEIMGFQHTTHQDDSYTNPVMSKSIHENLCATLRAF
jgi:hypothetical protein